MESKNSLYTQERRYSKISQWMFLGVSLIVFQLIAGGPFMPHMAAIAALIATLVSMVLMVIIRFTEEILSLFSMGGVVLGVLFLFGFLYGGFMVVILTAILVLGGGRWVGVLVPDIVLFSGQYWILLLAFAFEIGMVVWNLDFITRAANLFQTNQTKL
ncbi:MAG: hypothetical protein ACW97A_14210 [Candidatus Thorarchaeota archaeon]|jgi:hypothetical protein